MTEEPATTVMAAATLAVPPSFVEQSALMVAGGVLLSGLVFLTLLLSRRRLAGPLTKLAAPRIQRAAPAGGPARSDNLRGFLFAIRDGELIPDTIDARRLLEDCPSGLAAPNLDRLAAFFGETGAFVRRAALELSDTGREFQRRLESSDGRCFLVRGRTRGSEAELVLIEISQLQIALDRSRDSLEEIKAERDALRAILDNTPLPAWRRDASLDVVWRNRAAIEMEDFKGLIGADGDSNAAETAREAQHRGKSTTQSDPSSDTGDAKLTVVEVATAEGTAGFAMQADMPTKGDADPESSLLAAMSAFENLRAGIVLFDSADRLTWSNEALASLWGLSRDWLGRRPRLRDFINHLRDMRHLPEKKDFPRWRSALLAQCRSVEDPYVDAWHLLDGRTVRVYARPAGDSVMFLFEDMTELTALERRYRFEIDLRRTTLDRLDEAIAVFGPDGMTQLLNPRFFELWTFNPGLFENPLHIRDVANMFADRTGSPDIWRRVVDFATSSHVRGAWAAQLALTNGKRLKARFSPLPDGSTLIAVADITDSELMAEALSERNEALESAEEMREAFLNQISHQIRTPLNSAIGFAEMLNSGIGGPLTAQQQDYADAIIASSRELVEAVDGIVDLASVGLGAEEMTIDEVDLTALIETAARVARPRAAAKRCAIFPACDPALSATPGDGARLRQLIFNILQDAISQSAPESAIDLSAVATPDGALIRVRHETGVTDDRDEIAQAGVGLALSVARRLAAMHGGAILVTNEQERRQITAELKFDDPPKAASLNSA